MNTIKQKLRSRSGVSILFALLFVLVTAMVSMAIVSASVTAIKRTHESKELQRTSYALDSAAKMVKYKILGDPSDPDDNAKYSITDFSMEEDKQGKREMTGAGELQGILAQTMEEYLRFEGYKEVIQGPFLLSTNREELPEVEIRCRMPARDEGRPNPEDGSETYEMIFSFQYRSEGEPDEIRNLYCTITKETKGTQEVLYTWSEAGFSR